MSWPAERFGPMRDLKGVGRGMTGSVYQTYDRSLGRTVAIKAIKRSILLTVSRNKWVDAASYARAEIENLHRARGPHVLELLHHFVDSEHIFLVLDYAERGDLYSYMQGVGHGIPEAEAAGYVRAAAAALLHCQRRSVVHGDVKLENLLLTKEGSLLLADFGHSTYIDPRTKTVGERGGTWDYRTPEQFTKNAETDGSRDVWALGVVLVELINGLRGPFDRSGSDGQELVRSRVLAEEPDLSGLSAQAADLAARLLQKQPDRRPSLEEVLAHPWLEAAAGEDGAATDVEEAAGQQQQPAEADEGSVLGAATEKWVRDLEREIFCKSHERGRDLTSPLIRLAAHARLPEGWMLISKLVEDEESGERWRQVFYCNTWTHFSTYTRPTTPAWDGIGGRATAERMLEDAVPSSPDGRIAFQQWMAIVTAGGRELSRADKAREQWWERRRRAHRRAQEQELREKKHAPSKRQAFAPADGNRGAKRATQTAG